MPCERVVGEHPRMPGAIELEVALQPRTLPLNRTRFKADKLFNPSHPRVAIWFNLKSNPRGSAQAHW
jgi:hypothetical protein